MNKEEILAKSREENKNQDIYEYDVLKSAGSIATRIGLIFCCLIALLEVIFTGKVSFGSWFIFFGMLSTLFLVKFIKLHRRHELLVTVLYFALCIMFFILFIIQITGVM